MPCDTIARLNAAQRAEKKAALDALVADLLSGARSLRFNREGVPVGLIAHAGTRQAEAGWCEGCALNAALPRLPQRLQRRAPVAPRTRRRGNRQRTVRGRGR